MVNDDIKLHYEAVLRDLDNRCDGLRRQIAELNNAYKSLNHTRQNIYALTHTDSQFSTSRNSAPEAQKYADMSVRWAILCLLTESNAQHSIQEIAEALQAGGIRTTATNFNNNVSAVLSQMKAKNDPEVEMVEGRWIITDNGRSAWRHIKAKHQRQQFRRSRFPLTETPEIAPSGVS